MAGGGGDTEKTEQSMDWLGKMSGAGEVRVAKVQSAKPPPLGHTLSTFLAYSFSKLRAVYIPVSILPSQPACDPSPRSLSGFNGWEGI